MANDKIMSRHGREAFLLDVRRKKDWAALLSRQEEEFLDSDKPDKLAYRFAEERVNHNNLYEKEKAEMRERHKNELVEYKNSIGKDKSNDRERD